MSSKFDVTVSWAKPELQPLFHEVQLIRVEPKPPTVTRTEVDGVS